MKYYIQGKGRSVMFTQQDFVAKGGEGQIFRKGNRIFKIYEDPKLMIPEAKIRELSIIDCKNIIKPLEIILDPANIIVGFTMDYVRGEPLCRFFTNNFRDRNNFTEDQTIQLVENIKNATFKIHDAKCLIVDGNEFNYLVDEKDLVTPYFIDVNCWKTPSFPATAIMPTIRDWKSKEFSQVTDWFSFAIVTFQLFVGVHPFKGRHPKYKKGDVPKRVVDCISVFNNDVRVPPAARSMDLIPKHYRDWYYDLFEKGERKLPPGDPGARGTATTRHIVVSSTDQFEIEELFSFDTPVVYHAEPHGIPVTKTKKNLHLGKQNYRVSKDVEVLFTPKELWPIFVKIEDGFLKFLSPVMGLTFNESAQFKCEEKMIVGDILYIKNRGQLTEIHFFENSDQKKIFPVVNKSWGIMPNSSQFFGNVIFQDIFGKKFITIPVPSLQKKSSMLALQVPELDGHRIVDARFENNVCVVMGHKDNSYDRFVFKFDGNKYSIRVVNDVDFVPVNFTVLDNGIAIIITENDSIEIFSNKYGRDDIKEIKDPQINSGMRITKSGVQARIFTENKIFKIRMK